MAGTWQSFSAPAGVLADTAILLTDGTVLVHDANRPSLSSAFGGANWYRLTPDSHGDYRSGTWSSALPMATARQFFASGVLRDGRVFVVGGEFSDVKGASDKTQDIATTGEIFDPVSNTWSAMTKPSSMNFIVGDCVSCVLDDGRVLFGAVPAGDTRTAIWDPDTDTWTQAGTAFGAQPNTKIGACNEETWVLLRNGNVLTVQITGATATRNAEMYVPSNDSWVTAGATTQTLPVGTIGTTLVNEIGPAVTLPDGRVFFVGGTGRTQLYTSGSTSTATGSWAAGPSLPADAGNPLSPAALQTVLDGAAAVLPNGRVLVTGGPTISNNGFWSSPVTIYEFDSGANTLTALANQPSNAPSQTWQTSLLLLPNGHVLMTGEQNSIGEYIPDSTELTPKASWRPVLTAVPTALITGHTYAIAGRQLTGLTQATGYGDDRQNATNYPLVRLTNGAGDVRYLRTTDFSTLGIATGNATVTAALQVPPGIPPGAWNLTVVANGIASTPTPVSIGTRDCFLIMDRSTAGQGEVQALLQLNGPPALLSPAVFVVVEGFTAGELGLNADNLGAPPFAPSFGPPVSGLTVVPAGPVVPEDPSLPPNVPQRFTFPYALSFADAGMFGFAGPTEDLTLTATLTAAGSTVANSGILTLLKSPDPYILDGDPARDVPWWTSIDMRVFQVTEGGHRFGATLGTTGTAGAVATSFIQQVLTNLNTHPALGADFDAINPHEAPEALTLAPTDGSGRRLFNFAVAKVRLRDLNQDAPNVRVFFRMWPAQQTNAVHDTTTLYRTASVGSRHIALLGRQGDEIATIPFFAALRVNPLTQSMTAQQDPPNVRTIVHDSLGAEVVAYYGCWLDINQPTDLRLPGRLVGSVPANLPDGPFIGTGPLLSIQQHVRSLHQCLIAEINIDGQAIPSWADPSTSDKLAQRNLTFVGVPNPGVVESRLAPQPLQVRPTPAVMLDDRPDELMITWGNVPPGTTATIYLPEVDASAVVEWAHRLYTSNRIGLVDAHTLSCQAGGVTYLPLPGTSDIDYAGLLSLELPPTIRKGEHYEVSVRQLTGARHDEIVIGIREEAPPTRGRSRSRQRGGKADRPEDATGNGGENDIRHFTYRRTAGAFSLVVPVSTKSAMLGEEERTLSILRHIEQAVPLQTRWYQVFRRYVDQIAGRVAGMGGDPTQVPATPDGDWRHPHKCDHHTHDHDHDRDDDDQRAKVTGKVVTLRYDHFGDFEGFVVEDAHNGHVVLASSEQRVEALARRAWRQRLQVRARRLPDGGLASLSLAGHPNDDD